MIEFDVETTGFQWYSHELFLVTFWNGEGDPVVLRHPDDHAQIQMRLMFDDDYRAWNTKFDLHFLQSAGYDLPPEDRWVDGMVDAQLTNENLGLALKFRAAKVLGESERDDEKAVKKWLDQETRRRRKVAKANGWDLERPNYGDVPDEIMVPYAAQDVVLTKRLGDGYRRIIEKNPDLQQVEALERRVLPALYAAERRGVPADREGASALEVELVERLDELEDRCRDLAGIPTFNPGSSDQITEALKRRGADLSFVTKSSKTNKLSMDEENLSAVDDELAKAVLAFRGEYKVLGTYVRPLLHGDPDKGKRPFITPEGRIHPSFRQVGARTGRMSGADPNMQNWPRDDLRLRYLIHADPGHKLVAADLDSIELRLLAAFVGEGKIFEAVTEGKDLHAMTAQMVGLGDRQRQTGVETARQRGKTFNYAVIYGAGKRRLRKLFGVSMREAGEMLDAYHRAYPEVKHFQRKIDQRLTERGYVRTPYGRRQRVDLQTSYMAMNYIIQGTAADLLKRAAARLHEEGIPVSLYVHDEIIAHVPEADVYSAEGQIVAALTEHPEITRKVPITAEAKVVDHWSQAKLPEFVPDYARSTR